MLLSFIIWTESDKYNKWICTIEFWNGSRLFIDFEAGEDGDDSSGGGNSWREELQRRYQQENDFLAELRSRNSIPQTPSATLSSEQEQERGEREEADGEKEDDDESNWAEAVKRWVNR